MVRAVLPRRLQGEPHPDPEPGLRYEFESPVTERFNRLVADFDSTTPNPIEAAARANYARSPIPELSPADFRVPGGLRWTSDSARSPFRGEKNNLMPRIGLAWQATPKTTIRSGYGIYFDTIGVNTTPAIQTGFSQITPIQATLDEGLSFIATNADPLPRGLLSPLGPSGGLKTNLGQGIQFYSGKRLHPYSQRWSFGVQRLLPGQFVADVSYVGNRGTRLPVSRQINETPAAYLSTRPFRDQAVIDSLSAQFDNPLFGTDPIYGARTSRAALLRPFPQFGSVNFVDSAGYSWYHSLQAQAEKRFSAGYTLQFSYTFSKLMEAVTFLNATDPVPHRTIGGFDRPHRVTMSGIWEIPVLAGRCPGRRRHQGRAPFGRCDRFLARFLVRDVPAHLPGNGHTPRSCPDNSHSHPCRAVPGDLRAGGAGLAVRRVCEESRRRHERRASPGPASHAAPRASATAPDAPTST